MEWKELTNVDKAPDQGWVLAYLRKNVIFEQYDSLETVAERIGQGELLELHLFDKDKEYRCVASQSKRYPSGIVEAFSDFKDNEVTYKESIYLETKYQNQECEKKISLLNRLHYDENGMLEVVDYRLMMEEG